jgi:hypothetical protein
MFNQFFVLLLYMTNTTRNHRKSRANKTRKSLFKPGNQGSPNPSSQREGGLRGQGPRGEQKSIRGGFTPVFSKGS